MSRDPINQRGKADRHRGDDEAELLAYIEGELPSERAEQVERALAADPRTQHRVEALRNDRALLSGFEAEEAAPDWLLDGVREQLERDALFNPAAEPDARGQIPVSRVVPSRGPILARLFGPFGVARAAIAAGLLLLVGGGAYWAGVMSVRSSIERPLGLSGDSIAMHTDELASPEPDRSAASRPPAPTEPDAPSRARALIETAPAPEATEQTLLADLLRADERIDPEPPVTLEEAVTLAREGRLAVRITSRDRATTESRLATLVERTRRQRGLWRLTDSVPTAYAAVVRGQEQLIAARRHDAVRSDDDPALAAGRGADERLRIRGTRGAEPTPPQLPRGARPPSLYLLEVRAEDASLEAVLRVLATGTDRTAAFERLHSAVTPGPVLDPGAVLWWAGPPSNWIRRVPVPVIVE